MSETGVDKLFAGVKSLFKPSKSVVDNNIFRLHYRATVAILIGCSVMITSECESFLLFFNYYFKSMEQFKKLLFIF